MITSVQPHFCTTMLTFALVVPRSFDAFTATLRGPVLTNLADMSEQSADSQVGWTPNHE